MEKYSEFIEKIEEKHEIIEFIYGKKIYKGKASGEIRNPYWLVKNNETKEEYYIIICGDRVFTYVSKEDIKLVSEYEYTWVYNKKLGYVAAHIKDDKSYNKIYLHSFIMDHLGHGKGNDSVDHINRKRLDNRRENLRIMTVGENTSNAGKRDRSRNSKPFPKELGLKNIPKYVNYQEDKLSPKEIREKIDKGHIIDLEDDSDEYLSRLYIFKRSYFVITDHPYQIPNESGIRYWSSSKSKMSIIDKYLSVEEYLISIGDIYYKNTMIHPRELHQEFFIHMEDDDFIKIKKPLKKKEDKYIYCDIIDKKIVVKEDQDIYIEPEDLD